LNGVRECQRMQKITAVYTTDICLTLLDLSSQLVAPALLSILLLHEVEELEGIVSNEE
jgi:hypothetical protein